ncbi:hypothetical protein [Gluconobacter sp. DsW_056]|uniref:hypothetical protein n=1 Tax=Gluconobacter sp. DsW_056 TaxID=1511209 RepID=UPI00117ABD3E|nr:hypothetical protein [Gluconobacter sp. DsW_056]
MSYNMNKRDIFKGTSLITQHKTEYNTWHAMKHRCTNPKMVRYQDYGARGITVCKEWLDPQYGFSHFLCDMGCKPSRHYSLDRIDNGAGYRPDNCRWATSKEQSANKRPSRRSGTQISKTPYTYQGCTKTWKEWSDLFAIYSWKTTCEKKNLGLTFEEAMGLTGRSKQGRKPKASA